jgi:hypothetical protein
MKKLLLGCGALLLLLLIAAGAGVLLMPNDYLVERELDMQASPEVVYAAVSDLSSWPEWSVWNDEMDPDATWEFGGAATGNGATWTWAGPELGRGKITLRDCIPPSQVSYYLVMEDGAQTMRGTFLISAVEGGVRVRWSAAGELSGPWKLIIPLLDGMIGGMFEEGLQGLKARLEADL